jgi:hypothetical protein
MLEPAQVPSASTVPGFESRGAYITRLASELVDDVELSTLSSQALLMKTQRLARFLGADEWAEWLKCETMGYPVEPTEKSDRWMLYLGRWTNQQQRQGFFGSLPHLESYISIYRTRLQLLRVPDVNVSVSSANPNEFVTGYAYQPSRLANPNDAINRVITEMNNLSLWIGQLTVISTRVHGWIHEFVLDTYHQRAFSNVAESIFERYKRRVDNLLRDRCADALERVPSISDRLSSGDAESVSHALTTCRRIIDSFADAIYPPRDGTVLVGNDTLEVGPQQTRNRLRAYIHDHTTSESQRKKLRRTLIDLHDRVSTGVHSDVSLAEAQALFLETYLFLGALLDLSAPPPVPIVTPNMVAPVELEPVQDDLLAAGGAVPTVQNSEPVTAESEADPSGRRVGRRRGRRAKSE